MKALSFLPLYLVIMLSVHLHGYVCAISSVSHMGRCQTHPPPVFIWQTQEGSGEVALGLSLAAVLKHTGNQSLEGRCRGRLQDGLHVEFVVLTHVSETMVKTRACPKVSPLDPLGTQGREDPGLLKACKL